MSKNNIIYKIQDDYFKLLRDSLSSTQLESFLNLSIDDLREYIKQLLEPSGLVIPGRFRSRSSFENQINNLLVSIGRFWERYSEELLNNLITLDAYKITMQSQHFMINIENNIKKLGVYLMI